MITEIISRTAVEILDTTAYAGAFVLMALESMIAPVPSEAVMPFVGFLVSDGKWNLWLALLSTSLGSIAGALASYGMGYYGGKPLVLKVGKYLLLNRHDLEVTERYFHRRQGVLTVFAARFIPVVRHFISIPAGMGKMPPRRFFAWNVAGAVIWIGSLVAIGRLIGNTPLAKNLGAITLGVIFVSFLPVIYKAGKAWLTSRQGTRT